MPDDRIDFFFTFFRIFDQKWMQKGLLKKYSFWAFRVPERIKIASATQPRFFIDFASIRGPIFLDFDDFGHHFGLLFAVSPFSAFP